MWSGLAKVQVIKREAESGKLKVERKVIGELSNLQHSTFNPLQWSFVYGQRAQEIPTVAEEGGEAAPWRRRLSGAGVQGGRWRPAVHPAWRRQRAMGRGRQSLCRLC